MKYHKDMLGTVKDTSSNRMVKSNANFEQSKDREEKKEILFCQGFFNFYSLLLFGKKSRNIAAVPSERTALILKL